MADYPTDMKVDQETLNVFLDDTNDMGTIRGLANLEQSTAIVVRNATQQFIGDRITGSSVGLLEERVQRALNNDEQIEEVTNVAVTEFDRGTDTVTMKVETIENDSFTLGVTA